MAEKEEHVTKAELEQFAEAVNEVVCKRVAEIKKEIEAIRSEAKEPKDVELRFYHCDEEGCRFVTDDVGALVEHITREEVKKLSSELPKPVHVTAEEFLACPECFLHFEKAFLEKGWKKPEPKRKGSGLGI